MRTLFKTILASSAIALSAATAQEPRVTLNYEDADLRVVAEEIGTRTGNGFVLDPRVQGRVNIISPQDVALTTEEIFEVFLATLQVNNYTAVPLVRTSTRSFPLSRALVMAGWLAHLICAAQRPRASSHLRTSTLGMLLVPSVD